jgi:hypothetical protein
MTTNNLKAKLENVYGLNIVQGDWRKFDSIYEGYLKTSPDNRMLAIIDNDVVIFHVSNRTKTARVTWKIENIRVLDNVVKTLLF